MASIVQRVKAFQGKVIEVWFECSACHSRIGSTREVKGFKHCPVCGRELDDSSH